MHILRLVLREKPCIFDISDELKEKGNVHLVEWVSKIPFHSDKDKHFCKGLLKLITGEKSQEEHMLKNLQACGLVKNNNVPDGISKIIASYALFICICEYVDCPELAELIK